MTDKIEPKPKGKPEDKPDNPNKPDKPEKPDDGGHVTLSASNLVGGKPITSGL